MRIGAYECLTAMAPAGSGSARWCVAERDGRRYFLKQFLSPVSANAAYRSVRELQAARCAAFEKRKRRLYEALGCVPGGGAVPVADFFLLGGHYYAASEYIENMRTLEEARGYAPRFKRAALYGLARALSRLHAQGVVHADLKPEHILVERAGDAVRVRLIDFDSGFLEGEPPDEIEGDPLYMAPEAYLRMRGENVPVTRAADTFALGVLTHWLWAGGPPRTRAAYPYEAALEGGSLAFSADVPLPYRWQIKRMLAADPATRPGDGELERFFAPVETPAPPKGRAGGLERLMKKDAPTF